MMRLPIFSLALLMLASPLSAQDTTATKLRDEAEKAIKHAATFYFNDVSYRGGYVYYYSPDLKTRLGEGVATETQVWVQPPGTPAVGMAFMDAFRTTGDKEYLRAAHHAAMALVYGQLKSGGWTNVVDFDPRSKQAGLYRNGKGRGKNNSTFDDNTSESAVRLLMQVDAAYQFKDEAIHKATMIALDAILAAQYPNGAFPQVWTGPVPDKKPMKASYPDYDWRTEERVKEYWNLYTLNDDAATSILAVLVDAHKTYDEERFMTSIKSLGDFLIMAQMPEPQPGWAQQYTLEMRPAWARKFEPPAIAGRETQDAIRTLLKIHQLTGESKYLEPIQPALDYLTRSKLPDGRLARYYEIRTNKPLYMKRRGKVYSLTHDDSDLPSHYGWKTSCDVKGLEEEYFWAKNKLSAPSPTPREIVTKGRRAIESLDDRGRWMTEYKGQLLVGQPKFAPNEKFISSAVFCENIKALCDVIELTKRAN